MNMLSALAAFAIAPPITQGKQPLLLSAVMVRHQEPVGKQGIRATVAELYPIAWCTGNDWRDATLGTSDETVLPGDRFQIYQNGWEVGWFDVNRTASKPYGASAVNVGLGGWSLPRRLYPYRLVRSRNLNYLAFAAYTWGNDTYQNSIQPFLAINAVRTSLASTRFSPGQMKRDVTPVVLEQRDRLVTALQIPFKGVQLRLASLKAFDLDNDRIPEVVAVFDIPTPVRQPQRTAVLVGTVQASAFIERYHELNEDAEWQPLDVLDVDGDGYKEVVLLGRGDQYLGFEVLQRSAHGKMRRAFRGASFRTF